MNNTVKPWWARSAPDELPAQPWLHPAVIAYLDELVCAKCRILEFGGGGSTRWLAARCREVVTVEENPNYYAALSIDTPANVTLRLHQGAELPKGLGGPFDLLLIDADPIEHRAVYLLNALELVRGGGIVVLDNANRPEYAKTREWLRQKVAHYVTFEVNPPNHLYCVTEFYRLQGGSDYWI